MLIESLKRASSRTPRGCRRPSPAHMAHDPDKFWYAQVYSALCDCGHVLKDQLHRYFTSDDSDSDGVRLRYMDELSRGSLAGHLRA